MLTGVLGIRMFLMVGKTIPLPAPANLTQALQRVEVTNDADQGDGFQITFALSKEVGVDYSLLLNGIVDPFNRVVIGVLLGAIPEVLIDGVITHHQVTPSNDPGASTLTVTGKDTSKLLDLEEKDAKFENMPDFLIVTTILAEYARYGLIPMAMPTADIPIMLERIPRQSSTDLRYIQQLAQRNGYVFYTEPLAPGVSTAYFGPENRLGIPQPALTMNMGAHNNLRSLDFSYDSLAPVGTTGSFLEPITGMTIPIPSLPSLRVPPLALFPAPARRTTILREAANQSPTQAATTAVASVTRSPEAVSGQGEVDTVRYGAVLRARKLVGVRGVGFSYDGLYYVRRVTHTIERGDYSQKFSLSREGTGSLLPVVRT
ncbi:MAG: hypothetical protein K8J31_25530 [Anaerolineae bacterium]|nr:hypothetical protein [Anaerolineae bacterium]